jgi:purine-binding chemotaxis protein CheW
MEIEAISDNNGGLVAIADDAKEFITMRVGSQVFGMSVERVQDILQPQKIANIPLAPPEVIGSLNLRGRIVTALNIRTLLGIESKYDIKKCMSIVVEFEDNLYSFIVDSVGDVLILSPSQFVANPENVGQMWQEVSLGVFPREDELIVMLDVEKVFEAMTNK